MRIPLSSVNMHRRVQQNELMQQPRHKLLILEVVPKQFPQGWRRREENTSNVFRNQTRIYPLMNTRFQVSTNWLTLLTFDSFVQLGAVVFGFSRLSKHVTTLWKTNSLSSIFKTWFCFLAVVCWIRLRFPANGYRQRTTSTGLEKMSSVGSVWLIVQWCKSWLFLLNDYLRLIHQIRF